jgi:predicted SAM-dependent methyltransferase
MNIQIPWWGKIAAKLVLSRMPFDYSQWRRIGLFRHGSMAQSWYLKDIFNSHLKRSGLSGSLEGKTILELGPGDSIGSALFAASYGAKCILIDVGAYAEKDINSYKKLALDLEKEGFHPPDISNAKTLDEVLEACRAIYLTNGLKSFSAIDDSTIDLIFSQAVLEHVGKYEFTETLKECRRVIKPFGAASHSVDLKDHLGGGLNNLRFSERLWESDFFKKSGFYTNRIRYSEMLLLFKEAGFTVNVLSTDCWENLPASKKGFNIEFSNLPDDELSVKEFDVLLNPVVNK